jgi:hypothetical protein
MMKYFVELTPFRTYLDQLSDGATLLRAVQNILLQQPEIGDLVQGSGGIRKMRLAGKGKGKSGGYRVWYLYLAEVEKIYLMSIYSKNEKGDLSPSQRHELRKIVDILKAEARK